MSPGSEDLGMKCRDCGQWYWRHPVDPGDESTAILCNGEHRHMSALDKFFAKVPPDLRLVLASGWYEREEARQLATVRKIFLRDLVQRVESGRCPREQELFRRAQGDVLCGDCTRPYWDHPKDPEHEYLNLLCNGQRVKL